MASIVPQFSRMTKESPALCRRQQHQRESISNSGFWMTTSHAVASCSTLWLLQTPTARWDCLWKVLACLFQTSLSLKRVVPPTGTLFYSGTGDRKSHATDTVTSTPAVSSSGNIMGEWQDTVGVHAADMGALRLSGWSCIGIATVARFLFRIVNVHTLLAAEGGPKRNESQLLVRSQDRRPNGPVH